MFNIPILKELTALGLLLDPYSVVINTPQQISPLQVQQPTTIAQQIPALQQEGFVFEFKGCENTPNSDQPITCEFLIENSQEGRREFGLYATQSRIVDSSGNEIFASVAQIGGNTGTNPRSVLSSGIPLKASISFNEAPEGGIRLLDIRCWEYSGGYFNVEFRFS